MGLLTYELGNYWQNADPKNSAQARRYFKEILTNTNPLGALPHLSDWENWRDGKAKGRLFGGNMSMLDSLVGTEYFPSTEKLKGHIFFWELDNSPSYRVERVLTHLKYSGLFEVISGMVIGKLVDMKNTATGGMHEPTLKEVILSVLTDYKFPILAEVDFGHKMAQIPMPVGIDAEIDTRTQTLKLLEAAVI